MWSVITALLKTVIGPLTIAQALLKNFDANDEGIDDQVADGLKKALDVITGVVATDDTVPGQAKGLVAISTFCRGVIATLDGILASTSPFSDEQKATAQAAVDSLSDPAKVYQAKRGADAKALSDAKAEAAIKLAQILG